MKGLDWLEEGVPVQLVGQLDRLCFSHFHFCGVALQDVEGVSQVKLSTKVESLTPVK